MSNPRRDLCLPAGLRWLLSAMVLALVGTIVHFAVISDSPLPDYRRLSGGHNDLILHAGAFALLTILAVPVLRRPAAALTGLAVLAIVLEAAQTALPARTASWIDAAASLAGIGLGWLALVTGRALCALRWPPTRKPT